MTFFATLSNKDNGPGVVVINADNLDKATAIMLNTYGRRWLRMYTELSDVPQRERYIIRIIGEAIG